MKKKVALICLFAGSTLLACPMIGRAEPAFHDSIEWVIANSDRVVIGKVVKTEMVGKHEVATVEVQETLRGEHEPKVSFVLQEYCSGYAKDWMADGHPMIFFVVKIDGAKRRDQLPNGMQWVLHDNGNGNSAVLLGETKRTWPGTIDVFTRSFDHLTEPATIVKYVRNYAKSIPPERVENGWNLNVPHRTPAYSKVFPPQFPGNAFILRVPDVESTPSEIPWHHFALYAIGVLAAVACIWYFPHAWSKLTRRSKPPNDLPPTSLPKE